MLALLLALPCASPLDVVVFDNGMFNILDTSIVAPDDDLLIRIGPLGLFDTTVVDMRIDAVVRNVTLESRGGLIVSDASRVDGDLTIGPDCVAQIRGAAVHGGSLTVEGGGRALVTTSVSVGGIVVDPGGVVEISGGGRVAGDLVVAGRAVVRDTLIEGALTYDNTIPLGLTDVEILGLATFAGDTDHSFVGVQFQDGLTALGSASLYFDRATRFNGVINLEGSSEATIALATSNVGFGEVSGTSGVVVGTNRDGEIVSFGFQRAPGATLTVLPDAVVGTTYCPQPVENHGGLFGKIRGIGSTVLAEDNLSLEAFDLPLNTFAYFIVGTEPASSPFANDVICIGGDAGRYLGPGQIQSSGQLGRIEVPISTTSIPGNPPAQPVVGDTFYFQCWHRAHGVVPVFFTEAVAITFQ